MKESWKRLVLLLSSLSLISSSLNLSLSTDMVQVTTTVVNTEINTSTVEFSTGTATDELSNLQKSELGCLYQNGINKVSFNQCCGEKYSLINAQFIELLNKFKYKLIESLKIGMTNVCEQDSQPCDDLVGYVQNNIMTEPDLTQELVSLAEDRKNLNSVDSMLMDEVIAKFHDQYIIFLNLRISVAKMLLDTISDLQKYIKQSNIETDFDYLDYNPGSTLQSLGIMDINSSAHGTSDMTSDAGQIQAQSSYEIGTVWGGGDVTSKVNRLSRRMNALTAPLVQVKTLKDRSFNGNNFGQGLIGEAKDQKVLQYYVSNGIVNENALDLSQLPSVVLDQIRKNKLKLIGHRRLRV